MSIYKAPVFDLNEGRRQRDLALESMEDARELWIKQAKQALYRVAKRKAYISSNDVWGTGLAMDDQHSKALGSVFLAASRAGVILKTASTEQSKIAAHHARDVRIWKSLVFRD